MKLVIRISILSIAGAAQLLLTTAGCVFYLELLSAAFPHAKYLEMFMGGAAVLSLVWPIFAFRILQSFAKRPGNTEDLRPMNHEPEANKPVERSGASG